MANCHCTCTALQLASNYQVREEVIQNNGVLQVVAAGLAQTVEHSTVGPVRCVGPAVKFSLAENRVRGPPPTLGQRVGKRLWVGLVLEW